ncbi:OstA-like protein [Marinigracilibium pacificum]|uniref:Organic solvent tolerance-like N-terminal domain-containing protein n=1 Tax=Marinigracilibium pacificum TaxID=2729599 RepID=A0A848J6N9_9BACT|nr:OstA-like protein [Marinigracilibium pacificum]NMM50180.1 hypothetical protein [Marinigracilibium pacificum]
MMLRISLFFLLISIIALPSFSQEESKERVLLKNGGDYFEYIETDSARIGKFVGSPRNQVQFHQKDTRIFGDSVYQFKNDNKIIVFGHVKIFDGDTIRIFSKKATYYGNEKRAELRGDVKFEDGTRKLYTDYLDYVRPDNLAYYFNEGKLIDTTNILTSDKGYYNTLSKVMSFKNDVVLKNPDYTLYTDTLIYSTVSKVARSESFMTLVGNKGDTVNAYKGEYSTVTGQTVLERGTISTPDYILTGDILRFNEKQSTAEADQNVVMVSKENDLIITGKHARYWDEIKKTLIYGSVVMKKPVDQDTLLMRSDTLISLEGGLQKDRRILAFNNIRLYKSDLQGLADSLVYYTFDSLLTFYKDPILWTGDNQMTADTITARITNKTLDKMYLSNNSFVIQEDTLMNYNQIKGKDITVDFKEGKLNDVKVRGNGQSIYFRVNEELQFEGLNKIVSSDINMTFIDQKLRKLSFLGKPEGNFIPSKDVNNSQTSLEGFSWRSGERPAKMDIYSSTPNREFIKEKAPIKNDDENSNTINSRELKDRIQERRSRGN